MREAVERSARPEPYPALSSIGIGTSCSRTRRSRRCWRDRRPSARAARRRAPRDAAPRRDGVADRQLRRVERAPREPVAAGARPHGRRGARSAPGRGADIPRCALRAAARSPRRPRPRSCSRSAPSSRGRLSFFSTVTTRHGGRRHARGAHDRGLLPGGRRYGCRSGRRLLASFVVSPAALPGSAAARRPAGNPRSGVRDVQMRLRPDHGVPSIAPSRTPGGRSTRRRG